MIEYANDSVIRSLKQYDMLSKSLKLTRDLNQKEDICYQMTRIIKNVLDVTNNIYKDKYTKVSNRATYLMDEEKNKLIELINLINERKAYINNQITSNEEITGIIIDTEKILGEEKLEEYKEEVKIIEKYKHNIQLDETLKNELTKLNISIKRAKDKISSNKILNKQLEEKMIKLLDKAIEKLSLNELQEREEEIELAYTELGYSLEIAKENALLARKEGTTEIKLECDNLLASITLEYERYKEKKLILKLMKMYKNNVNNYEELLKKREEMNNILSGIISSDLYLEVGNELNKEYATIKLEQQDSATLKSLEEEKEIKTKKLQEINQENDSEQFKGVLAHLLENEKKYQEKLMQDRKRKEEERKARELEKEKIKQKEILRRQKALEEERKKEIEERTKQLLVEKKNPVLFTSKGEKSNSKIDSNYPESHEKRDKKLTSVRPKTIPKNSQQPQERKNLSSSNITPTRRTVPKNPNISRANIKPSDDIFSRERNPIKTQPGIPVIKQNKLDSTITQTIPKTKPKENYPKVKINKEEDIFPTFPDLKSESFFDEDEFKDLNKFTNNKEEKSWF